MKLVMIPQDAWVQYAEFTWSSGLRYCPKMAGFLYDNQGQILPENEARNRWYYACVRYSTRPYRARPDGTYSKGFSMNVPWLAKRCGAVKFFTEAPSNYKD